ncbi:MAG: hypothetical protein VW498_02230 [Candidatus Thalassarchaeaceae archaeon]
MTNEKRSPHPELMSAIGQLNVTAARLDERVASVQTDVSSIKKQLDKHDDRLTNIEKRGNKIMGGVAVLAIFWGWVSKHISF